MMNINRLPLIKCEYCGGFHSEAKCPSCGAQNSLEPVEVKVVEPVPVEKVVLTKKQIWTNVILGLVYFVVGVFSIVVLHQSAEHGWFGVFGLFALVLSFFRFMRCLA